MQEAYYIALANLINKSSFHGNDLVLAMGGADNVWFAEKLLLEAEQDGLIIRGNFEPSKEQAFFGVGGLNGKNLKVPYASPVCYHWITKTIQYL